jgi:acid phosphatase type 7
MHNKLSCLSSFLILTLLTIQSVSAATVTRGPYLQMGTANSIVVRWRTDTASESRVRHGSAPGNLTVAVDNPVVTTEHEVSVAGLAADTVYYYSVGTISATLAGNDSSHFFVTLPTVGTATPMRIWVLGDPGTQTASQFAVRDAYYNFTGARHTDLWLMLGDNAYNTGTDSEYQGAVFNTYPTMLRKSVLFSALGNHETAQSTAFVDTYPYFGIFTFPRNGECGGTPSGTEHYYSFDAANIHFICLDSMTADRSPTGPMANWVQSDLASTLQPWVVAFWHHPPYSKGSHNSDTEIELVQMRQNFLPILEAGGVDLVLAGHSHAYERSYLIDGHYGASTTFSDANLKDGDGGRGASYYLKPAGHPGRQGAVYSVAGSSGQISGGTLNHSAMFLSLNVLGSMVLDFDNNRLDAQFLDSVGTVRDVFTIFKGNVVPGVPTGLAAGAGDARVDLSWNITSGAASYNVKRSTIAGGPYVTIAPGVTATGYADTSAANGTTYFYVVSAVNATGESGNSSEVSATPQTVGPPAPPTALVARAAGKKKINLAWTQSSSPGVTQNSIYRSTSSGGPFALVATISAATSYNNSGLTSGTTYYYFVTAVTSAGESAASNEASATAR